MIGFITTQRIYATKKEWYEEWFDAIFDDGEIIPITLFILSILFIISLFRKTRKDFHSNWNTLIPNFSFSTKEFYELVQKELHAQGIKGVSFMRAHLPEGGIGSPRRRYLRINWKSYRYDMCGAPFGSGFFVSWWLMEKTPILKILLSKIPFIGMWLVNKLHRTTYYKIDTASMFMTYAHEAVVTVINRITQEKGIKPLSEDERKPVLNNIFTR